MVRPTLNGEDGCGSAVDRPTDRAPVATNLCLFIAILDGANCCCRSNVSTLSEQGRLSTRLYLMLTSWNVFCLSIYYTLLTREREKCVKLKLGRNIKIVWAR